MSVDPFNREEPEAPPMGLKQRLILLGTTTTAYLINLVIIGLFLGFVVWLVYLLSTAMTSAGFGH